MNRLIRKYRQSAQCQDRQFSGIDRLSQKIRLLNNLTESIHIGEHLCAEKGVATYPLMLITLFR